MVPVAIPQRNDSRTHHLKGESWMDCWIPNWVGRYFVQVAVSGDSGDTVADSLSDILLLNIELNCGDFDLFGENRLLNECR